MRQRWLEAWRGGGYLLVGLSTAVVTLLALPLLALPVLARGWADWHRRRAGWLLGIPVSPRPVPLRDGRRAWRPQVLTDPATRRDLAWLLAHLAAGGPFGFVALLCVGNMVLSVVATPLWWAFPADDPLRLLVEVPVTSWARALTLLPLQFLVLAGLAYWVFPLLARTDARLCLAVLAPSAAERLAQRVEVLTQTRAGVMDAHGAELRRIERDLHDGTQARLVAIAMRLGVAREALTDNPELVAKLLQDVHEGAEEAMAELRDMIRTTYPPILADRGLPGAVAALAARSGVPAQLDLGELGAIPAAVETAAYFVVAEALTNAAKHSRATHATVRLTRREDRLAVQVTDDGTGGADETRGTGLAGIHRRVLALDGAVHLSSPVGGPTTVAVELPCGS